MDEIKELTEHGDGVSRVKAPVGRMLVKTINDQYPTLLEALLELVQNGIDANASSIAVLVDKKKRSLIVCDDGDGVSKAKYEAALLSVMSSNKTRDKIGQFGMGMLSPVAKCAWHTLTSCAKGSTTFLEWSFDTREIERQLDEVYVPHRERTDLRSVQDPRGKEGGVHIVEWQTLVEVHKYTTDRFVSRLPSAQGVFDQIVGKYREKLLENNVKLAITILTERGERDVKMGYAEPYNGRRLPAFTIKGPDAGTTYFNLYLARKNEKGAFVGQGVSIGEADNAYRFPFKMFERSLDRVFTRDVVDALNSGVFEGDILTERAKLHSNRKSFVHGDSLLGFCEAIEEWYEKVGKEHYDAAVDARAEERYKELGEDLKRTLEGFLSNPSYADLLKPLMNGVVVGVRPVHQDDGDHRMSHGSSDSDGSGGSGGGSSDSDGSGGASRRRRDSSDPPKRRSRAKVQSRKLGLEFDYREIYDEKVLWAYEPGVIIFNTLHSQWRACEKSLRRQRQLQELISIKAIMLQVMPEGEWRDHAQLFAQEMIDPIIYLLLNSPNFQQTSLRKGRGE